MITQLVVYTPAEDVEVSKAFYTALGFTLTEGFGGTMDCTLGGATFRLQDYYVKDWAENFMMKFDVPDVQEWYDFAKPIIERGDFGHARIASPAMVGDTPVMHIWDPCGVLLVFVGPVNH